jgi:hypothetical protein
MTNVYHHYRKSLLLIVFFCVQFVFNSFAGAAGNVTTNRDSTIVDSLPPFINSFTPIVGRNGTAVLIFGKHLTGTVKVSFGGTLASNFIILSDTAIKAVVGTGASGSVSVTTPFGTGSKAGFIFIQDSTLAPVVTSFNPTSARRGSKVLIKGIHFTGTNAVRFGGVLADTVTFVNDTLVIAVVGAGASGNVSVTTPFGTGSKAGFIFIQDSTLAPVVTSFNPTSARRGSKVLINGIHFTGTNAVRFGGVLADTVTLVNDTVVIAVVGAGASGSVSVTTPFGTGSKAGFTFIQDSTLAPVVTSFNPTSARRGSKVLINGIHFNGTNAVRFGGVLADTVTFVNDTVVIAVVGAGASGSVSVTTPFGTGSKAGFIFIQDSTLAPVVTSFNPTGARRGSKVLINGLHFNGTNAVRFGGVLADTVTFVNDTVVIAVVGAGASGNVSVTTPFGTGSKSGFIFIQDSTLAPVVTSFNPTSARRGSKVLINGIHFTGTNAVRFGGVLADTITFVNDTVVIAVVGAGASGNVSVTTPFGTGSKAGFIFIQDSTLAPVISLFTPDTATTGTFVNIKGAHFTGTNAVRFGGVLADTFSVLNDSLLWAVVGAGASGNVSVTTPFGTGIKSGFVFIGDSLFVTARSSVSSSSTVSTALSLYPNPASKYAIVINPITHHPSHLQVVDLMGRIVRTMNVGREATKTTVDVSGLTAGIYKLVWSDGKKVITHTLLVK